MSAPCRAARRRAHHPRRATPSPALPLLALVLLLAALQAGAQPRRSLPLRADAILGPSLLRTPPIDATVLCPAFDAQGPLARFVRGDPEASLIELSGPVPDLDRRTIPLLRSAIAARSATTIEARREARETLRTTLTDDEAGETGESTPPDVSTRELTACAQLELARVELALGLHPEAAASARRVWEVAETPTRRSEAAKLLMAEALYLGGSPERTIPLFLDLTRSQDPRLASAARLRLVDLRFDHGQAANTLADYGTLLARADEFGADARAWGPRAVEAAIDADQPESAERWLEQLLEGDESPPLALSIRRADVQIWRGDLEAGHELLTGLPSRDPDDPEAALVRLRLHDWNLEGVSRKEAIAALEQEVANAREPGVASYARLLLARKLLDERRIETAVTLLVRVAHDRAVPPLTQSARVWLGDALAAAAEDVHDASDCPELIERLTERQTQLLRTAPEPDAFLLLGDCYERYRLPRAALELYRATARRFGARVAADVALPIARTSLAAGETATAREAAERNVAAGGEVDPGWKRVLGEARLAEGAAGESIAPLVELARTDRSDRLLALLARAASQTPRSEDARQTLYASLREADVLPSELAVSGLLAADAHRRAGDTQRAREIFRKSLEGLSGPLRAEARYWWQQLGGRAEEPPEIQETERTSAFAALAAEQAAQQRLAARLSDETP